MASKVNADDLLEPLMLMGGVSNSKRRPAHFSSGNIFFPIPIQALMDLVPSLIRTLFHPFCWSVRETAEQSR